MKKFALFILFLIIVGIGVAAYLGFVPGLSPLLVKPRDLGKVADKSLVTAFETKYGNSTGTGQVDLNVQLTDTQVTSIFAVWEDRDKLFPLHSVQIRFNSDGSGEASGYVRIAQVVDLATNLGYSSSDISAAKKYINYVSGDLVFYVKGTGGMTDNVLSLNPQTFELGRVKVPDSITVPATRAVEDMIKKRLTQIGGADIKQAGIKDGTFQLVGRVPATIKY
jgi:hypothetical protein